MTYEAETAVDEGQGAGVRLQKYLARAGFGSRRACEGLITGGRISVNGRTVTELGTRVDLERDEVRVDGESTRRSKSVYFAFHKPQRVACTQRIGEGERRVVDFFPRSLGRLFTVGRLDIETEGLLLVTNDGAFANHIAHPRYGVPKTYHAVVHGKMEGRAVEKLRKGIFLSEGKTGPIRVRIVKRAREMSVLRVTLAEGKKREVRRALARVGHPVKSLTRIRIGSLNLGSLPRGHFRPLTDAEIRSLQKNRTEEAAHHKEGA